MAGAGKKTFTAGEVLTASDVNTYLMEQSVMYFGGTAARASAIPTPSTGMVSYVGDTGTVSATGATIVNVPQIQAYTGAAWQNVDGLTLVAKATVGTTVSSVTMSNVFSATYEAYRIVLVGSDGSGVAANTIKFGSATTNYYYSNYFDNFNGIQTGTDRNNNTLGFIQCGIVSPNDDTNVAFDVINPFAAKRTTVSGTYFGNSYTGFFGGVLADTTSYTAFTLGPLSGTFTGGTIYVYGYRSA
jgi:hypothetical protein